jgi:hypothetical protein
VLNIVCSACTAVSHTNPPVLQPVPGASPRYHPHSPAPAPAHQPSSPCYCQPRRRCCCRLHPQPLPAAAAGSLLRQSRFATAPGLLVTNQDAGALADLLLLLLEHLYPAEPTTTTVTGTVGVTSPAPCLRCFTADRAIRVIPLLHTCWAHHSCMRRSAC